VKITKKDGTVLPGKGLEASQDFRNIKIINPSQGILPVPESEFTGATMGDSTIVRDSAFVRDSIRPVTDTIKREPE
jgi:hypothetical protein